jgi:hypothetical protein
LAWARTATPAPPASDGNGDGSPPKSGKGLWAWAKDHGATGWFIAWGRRNRWADKMTNWSPDEVLWAYGAYQDQLAANSPGEPESDHEGYVRRTNEKREAERRESEQFSRTGR